MYNRYSHCFYFYSFIFSQNHDTENTPSGNEEKEQAMSISSNFQDVKVIDTSEHKLISSAKTRIG